MKRLLFIVFIIGIICGCGAKGYKSSSYPDISLNERLETSTAIYIVTEEETTGSLLIEVRNISNIYASVNFRIFVISDQLNKEADAQIALDLRKGQSHIFVLPFIEKDLPITVNYVEEYQEFNKYQLSSNRLQNGGFTVGKEKARNEKEKYKVEDITPK